MESIQHCNNINNFVQNNYKSKIISFSSDSSKVENTTCNEYAFKYILPETIKNAVGIKIQNLEIPFTYHIINENNSQFSWVSYDNSSLITNNTYTVDGEHKWNCTN